MSDRGISPEHLHPSLPATEPPEKGFSQKRGSLMTPIMRVLDMLGRKSAQHESKITEPITPDQLIQMIRLGLDPNRTDPSSLQISEKEGNVDEMTRQNERLGVALNTLLFSFPPGEQQDAIKERFPEVDDELLTYDVKEKMNGYEDKATGAGETQAELTQLLTKAIDEVGGTENALFYFEFPGVTNDEVLEQVRPIPQRWLETSLDANTLAPQMSMGIATKLGSHVLGDIAEGKSHWEDVIYGYLDRDQITTEKALVAKLHAAHRQEPMMPEGHPHPHSPFTIPDSRFQSLWRGEVKSMVTAALLISQWAEDTAQISLPFEAFPMDIGNFEEVVIDKRTMQRLNALFSNEEALPYIEVMLRLFTVAKSALDSEQGAKLQGQQRDENNNRKHHPEYETPAASALHSLLADALYEEVDRLTTTHGHIQFPSNLASAFLRVLNSDDLPQLEYDSPEAEHEAISA